MALTGGDLARKRLAEQERREIAYFLAEFLKIRNRMSGEIDATIAALDALKKAGEKLDPAILARNATLARLLKQIEAEIARLAPMAAARLVESKRFAVRVARLQAAELPIVNADLHVFDAEATTELMRIAGDGQPLRLYFEKIAEPVRNKVFESLFYGIAAGLPNRAIANEIGDAVGGGAVRAMTVARTETNRAYREASRKFYDQEPAVLRWRWRAVLDLRTCPICWQRDGQEFDTETPFETHPNCRCVMEPILEITPPVVKGPERFERLTPAQQKAILGPKRFDLYGAGTTLDDFVGVRSSPFGRTPFLRPLSDFDVEEENDD